MASLTWTNLFTLTSPNDYKATRLLDNLMNQISTIIQLETSLKEEIYLELDANLKYLENILETISCWQLALYLFLDEEEQSKLLESIKITQKIINNFRIYKKTEFLSIEADEKLKILEEKKEKFFEYKNIFYYSNKEYKINEKFKITSNNESYFPNRPIKKNIKNPDFFEKQVLYAEKELKKICQPAFNRFLFVVFTLGLGMIAIKASRFVSSFWKSSIRGENQQNPDETNNARSLDIIT